MAHVFPAWAGWFLLNPLRKLTENPEKILGPHVTTGMTVLEPGCGMGFFTLPLARMVGESGRVVAVDVQQAMLDGLQKRAGHAGLAGRIEPRLVNPGMDGVEIQDLQGRVDFIPALHVVHEAPDQQAFLRLMRDSLKPGGRLLVVEPRFKVGRQAFEALLSTAASLGLKTLPVENGPGRRALFVRK